MQEEANMVLERGQIMQEENPNEKKVLMMLEGGQNYARKMPKWCKKEVKIIQEKALVMSKTAVVKSMSLSTSNNQTLLGDY